MNIRINNRRARLGTAVAAVALGLTALAGAPAQAQPKAYSSGSYRPTTQVPLSVGEGQMINLPRAVASVWTSNPKIADVYVNGSRQINVFGKDAGEATVIATAADGSVVYGARVRVSPNISSVDAILREAMPDSNIRVTTVGQVAVLNGTVASPEDATQAELLVKAMLNAGIKEGEPLNILPVNRLKTATPLQVNLKVKIAEVNRSLLKQIGVNLLTQTSGGFSIGIAQGEGIHLPPVTCTTDCADPRIIRNPLGSTLSGVGKLFGMDIMSSLDLAEVDGFVTTLAEPNLTALSGETASFLAGGEFPIPVSQDLGVITVEYKQYGVGLAFTPIVLSDGRISMRVRPEVSELSAEGSIKLNNFDVPALVTRRAETTVELGSGQSFMIAGLLRNTTTNNIDKAPFLGDLPILGALFRSTSFKRQETELVIIVTPYLVRPVSGQLASPVDGYRAPNDADRIFMGQSFKGVSSPSVPLPPPANQYPAPAISAPVTGTAASQTVTAPAATAAAAPGFKL
jgi:pilus assembly protein CpaC